MRLLGLLLLALFGALITITPLHGEDAEAYPSPYVGMAAKVEGLFFPGSELIPAPLDDQATPLVLRVLKTYPHGTAGFRYDLEFYGLLHGEHDLSSYLVRADGSLLSKGEIPAVKINVRPALPEGPPGLLNALPDPETPRTGGYRALLVLFGLLWLGGLAMLLFFRRPETEEIEEAPEPPSLADKLRPLVERALDGDLDLAGQAELERHLMGYWREQLDLQNLPVAEGIRVLREHSEGGKILREVEGWLHSREGADKADIEALLQPYV